MITIERVHFYYQRNKPVLDNLQFQLQPGQVCGLLGTNGEGKTTLLHLIGGLLRPKSGKMEVLEYNPAQRHPSFLEEVFYVPVAFELPNLTAEGYRKRYADFYPEFSAETWTNALQAFEVDPETKLKSLSFGQKKKVLLSFALASGCKLLLFDEPTDGLDIPSRDQFRRLLSASMDEQRTAIIATHHANDMALLFDHLLILKNHQLVLNAPLPQLAQKLHTVVTAQLPENATILYSERVAGGYHCLVQHDTGQEGPIDLEILFKAIHQQPVAVVHSLISAQ